MPRYSRKDYELVASILNEATQAFTRRPEQRAVITWIETSFAAAFKNDNPKFNSVKFFHAVGGVKKPAAKSVNKRRSKAKV